ncbi:MAG: homocysteine S-methyltransferase family protein [Pseudomonadota bacterium]|nr:homocysteine S-methyltransferase family protein [Pseudomonadota bacterium]
MPKYRANLPLLSDRMFLTDSGLETTLIFHEGIELPFFAAFHLLKSDEGIRKLGRYYARHAAIAEAHGLGFILESPTWRASPDWGERLGYSLEELAEANRKAIELMVDLREGCESARSPMVISGCVGPRGDGYDPGRVMSAEEAEAYHAVQIGVFADTEADLVTAITMTNVPEAIGVTRAAAGAGMPVVISFTLDTDGRLPTGETLKEAVLAVDQATGRAPLYYMINCAHPTHFADVLASGEPWLTRLKGLRANASKRSHAELDSAPDLDAGDPVELGRDYRRLLRHVPHVNVLGGCCGTDHRHVEAICLACLPEPTRRTRAA